MTTPSRGRRGAGFKPAPFGYRVVTCSSCGNRYLIEADDDTPECMRCHDGEQVGSVRYLWPIPLAAWVPPMPPTVRGLTVRGSPVPYRYTIERPERPDTRNRGAHMDGAHMHREHRPPANGQWLADQLEERREAQATEAARREARPDLHDALVTAGCTIEHHESDLYVLSTETARRAIIEAGYSLRECQPFTSQVDGRIWLDFPFRYSPYWRERSVTVPHVGATAAPHWARLDLPEGATPAPPVCDDCGEHHSPEEVCD